MKHRLPQWIWDRGLLHYCHRCDHILKPWQKCRHNGRWNIVRFDR